MALIPRSLRAGMTNPAYGVKKFRPPEKIRNRILYGLLLVEGISTYEVANTLHPKVSQRAVQSWIADGRLPKDPGHQEQLCKMLNCPSHILWFESKESVPQDVTR